MINHSNFSTIESLGKTMPNNCHPKHMDRHIHSGEHSLCLSVYAFVLSAANSNTGMFHVIHCMINSSPWPFSWLFAMSLPLSY